MSCDNSSLDSENPGAFRQRAGWIFAPSMVLYSYHRAAHCMVRTNQEGRMEMTFRAFIKKY